MVQITDILSSYKIQKSTYQLLKKSQKWNQKKLFGYQYELLKNLLNLSYKNVPYYKDLFNNQNLKPNDIKSVKDLKKIPFLTRDIIITKYGSISLFIISIPIYGFIALKYASKLDVTIDAEEQKIEKFKAPNRGLKRYVTKFDIWFSGCGWW